MDYFCIFTTKGILTFKKGTKPKYLDTLISTLDPHKHFYHREVQQSHLFCQIIKETVYLAILKHNDPDYFKKEVNNYSNQPINNLQETSINTSLDFSERTTPTVMKIEQVKAKKTYSFNLFSKSIKKDELREKMRDHLINKNINTEIAIEVVENVLEDFDNKIYEKEFKIKLKNVIKKMLYGVDHELLLKSIREKRTVYRICFVGVNGVGKSTSLAKICCWLLQKKLKVYIAACDTFRAGAIEQLGVHVEAFKKAGHNVGFFSSGYNKDDANVARQAIIEAEKQDYDVILIDTAGRMHNKKNLMDSLSKIIRVNEIDHIIFVGEALVGNDSLEHLREFNRAIKNGRSDRAIDSLFVTKIDTVDDKIGQILNMCVSGECPILFLGTGQTNMSISKIDSNMVVDSLMN